MKKNILIITACVLAILSVLAGIYINGETSNSRVRGTRRTNNN